MGKPKIEIIQIGLDNLNIVEEIRGHTSKITVDTTRFANLRPVSKKKRDAAQWIPKIEKAVKLLLSAKSEDRMVSSKELTTTAGVEIKKLSGFISRIQSYLRRDDEWTLGKKRIKNLQHYFLIRFSA